MKTENSANKILKEVWELNYNLELNQKYYDAIREDSEIRNEIKVVEQKIELMKDLNDDLKPLFGTDLVSKFQKINQKCKETSANVSDETVNTQLDAVKRKYAYYGEQYHDVKLYSILDEEVILVKEK